MHKAFNKFNYVKDKLFLDTLISTVEELRGAVPKGKKRTNWTAVLDIMSSEFPSRRMTKESLRNSYRRITNTNNVNQITKKRDDKRMGRTKLEQRLLAEIKTKRPIDYLCERLDVPESKIYEAVAKLQMQGYRAVAVFKEDGVIYVHNRVRFTQPVPGLAGSAEGLDITHLMEGDTVRFAVVSDTHFGSIMSDKKSLSKFYDRVVEEGITTVLHVGDLSEGYYPNRPTSVHEQDAVGFTEQLKQLVREYPRRDGVTTYCITGNHDFSFMRAGHANIGDALAAMRDDIVYLGHNFGRIWLHPSLDVSMIHPTDGVGADYTRKIRDIVERNPQRRGKIMLVGHYHKWAMVKHKGIYGYLVPSFEKKTSFMDDNNLTSEVGGVIFEVKIGKKGDILSVVTEYVDYSI